jgi:AcrR family transcriptional regulator
MRDRFWGAPRRGYHHGNLRETLIEAARHLIAVNGPEGFSLIEAARLAEVSPAAPYRHFTDRNALVDAVAERGFVLFGERLKAAAVGTHDATTAFRRMGAAYLAFAREEPGFYAAMFELRRAPATTGEGEAAFGLLAAAVRGVVAPGSFDDTAIDAIAVEVWALSHGIAMLTANRALLQRAGVASAEAMLDSAVTALIEGHLARRRQRVE